MVLRNVIPIPPSEATASYDYADIQEGTGNTVYNLAQTELSGGVLSNFLIRNTLYSGNQEISGATASGKFSDNDFDIEFNRPQNLKGTAYVNIPHATTGSGQNYLHVRARKFDGTTETEIDNAISRVLVNANKTIHAIPLTIPLTHFKKGDIFRLTVEGWGNGASQTYGYGVDPQDRQTAWMITTGGATNTKSTLTLPFVLKV